MDFLWLFKDLHKGMCLMFYEACSPRFYRFYCLTFSILLVFLLETSGDFLYEFYLGLIALFMGHVTDYWVIILLKLVMWTFSFARVLRD